MVWYISFFNHMEKKQTGNTKVNSFVDTADFPIHFLAGVPI